MEEPQKIGLVAWYQVKRHSRILYLRLIDMDVEMYDIQPGDKLKVEIQAIKRGPREEQEPGKSILPKKDEHPGSRPRGGIKG